MPKYKSANLFGADERDESVAGCVVRVAFDSGADSIFDYIVPEALGAVGAGQRVEVPFGRANRLEKGFCVEVVTGTARAEKCRAFKLKLVKKIIDKTPLLNDQLLSLAEWISGYYVCPLGQVLAAMVPAAVKKGAGVKKDLYIYLAAHKGEEIYKVTGKKQRLIVDILEAHRANSGGSGILKKELCQKADCTAGPLNKLIQNGVVKVSLHTAIRSLPAVPAGLAVPSRPVVLNEDQRNVLRQIDGHIAAGTFSVSLLYGVTDSGKTEVYIRAIQTAIANKKAAIVMLPEIALTTQMIQRFSQRFERIAVMHSRLTAAQRNAQWQKINTGEADVVIGARSSVFAPLSNLGLIVVDEEHEPSYKQDTVPRYHGRDVAIKRAQLAGAHCILGSATPSLETLSNCRTKKHFTMLKLPRRVMDLPRPEMRLVDMSAALSGSGQKGINLISPELEDRLRDVLLKGEQAILLLNRRGYSNFVFCPSCGHTLGCKNCDVTLTFHKRAGVVDKETVTGRHMSYGYAICHYCLAKMLVPQKCPLCAKRMTMIGIGSQRLTEELAEKFPKATVARVDTDSMARTSGAAAADEYYRVLRDFAEGRTDILAGTQMLAKGLHFPNVTLVGIVSADTALSLPDFRANERTFQLICQVAGRTGRSKKGGVVIVQTFLPDQPAIKFALAHDYEGFVKAELSHRAKCNLPPSWRMAIVGMRDTRFDKLDAASEAMRLRIAEIVKKNALDVKIRGPMPAVISRIQRFHRMQLIVQAPSVVPIQRLFAELRIAPAIRPAVKVSIDIDPINLL